MSSTKNSLFSYTSLSPDIINTIDEYVWQSLQSLAKNVKYKSYHFRKDITLCDIFILCMNMGKRGFWLLPIFHQDLIEKLKKMAITENLTNDIVIDDIIVEDHPHIKQFFVKYCPEHIVTFPLTRISECWVDIEN
jgi:uncharacterized protein YqhQ